MRVSGGLGYARPLVLVLFDLDSSRIPKRGGQVQRIMAILTAARAVRPARAESWVPLLLL